MKPSPPVDGAVADAGFMARSVLQRVGLPARNLTPVPSPIALPPTGRGGLSWSGVAGRFAVSESVMVREDILQAPSPQQSPPLPDGGRAMGEGTGVRFRAGGRPRSETYFPAGAITESGSSGSFPE